MRALVAEVVEQLERYPSRWRDVIDEVRFEEPAIPDASAEVVVEPVRWLVQRVGSGLTLTGAGYLPPAVVAAMWHELGYAERYPWIGKGNREEHARPVLELREAATRLGLLRLAKGRLTVTKAGAKLLDDPVGLWWHTAARMPTVRGEIERQAGVLVLLLAAAGRAYDEVLVADALSMLGWAAADRSPILPRDVIFLTRDTLHLLEWLGLRPSRWSEREEAPPPAAVAFARAAVVGASVAAPDVGPEEAVELTVTLREVEPPVWRRLVMPSTLTLLQTHDVLQAAMGWENSHLHQFVVAGTTYADVEDLDEPLGDPRSFTLADVVRAGVDAFEYDYDFGDGWSHEVRLGAVASSPAHVVPHVLDGSRACPPEDCGGPGGYEELLLVLGDPHSGEHAELREWLGRDFDAEAFDVAAVNAELARVDRRRRRLIPTAPPPRP